MVSLNFVGGASPGVSTSWTGYSKVYSTSAANGVALPTNRRLDSLGNRPVYVSTAEVYWAGRGGSRSLRIGIGSSYSSWYTIGSDTSANASGQKTINGIFLNGGNQVVTIDENGSSGFYFGRASSGSGSTDGVTTWGALSGSLVYYEAPNAPTSVTVSQAALENAVNVSWTASSDNGGTAVTSHSITWSYSSTFATSTTIQTGSSATSYKITGLAYGSTVYVKVASSNAVTAAAGSTSVYSSSASGYITAPDLPLNGWAHFGTATNNTWTLSHTVIPALVPETGMLLTGTASATGGTYTSGAVGISKTYTDLIIGRQYIVSGKAILRQAGVPANIYRFAVTGIGNGSSVTLTSTTVGSTIPSYTFTATSTTHTVEIELAETFTVSATGVQESVAFYDYALTKVATDLVYRVQDNEFTGSLVDHFDLATQSVGAYWWVDKNNVTQFAQDFDYSVPVAEFTDTTTDGAIYYNKIDVSYDTSAVINGITLNNIGRRALTAGGDLYEGYEVEWTDSDATSVTNWGARNYDLQTNLWTSVHRQNLLCNPSLAYSSDYIISASANVSFTRQTLATLATGANFYLSSGATQPVTGAGQYVAVARATATQASIPIAFGGIDNIGTPPYPVFPVTPSTQYTGSVYMRLGVSQSSTTGQVQIRWYTDAGVTISTSVGTTTSLSATAWTRISLTATAPATAAYGVMFAYHNWTGTGSNTAGRYFSTAAQFEAASSASTWFSGDTVDNTTYVYSWDGTDGASSSTRYNNIMDTRTGELLTDFADPIVRVNSLTWNTAQNPIVAANTDIGSLLTVTFKGTTATYRVVGIKHDINPERWMMSLEVAKVV